MTQNSLQAELLASITSWTQRPDEALQRDTPLISSARLDSFQLVRLLVWIEEKVGRKIDATAIDIAEDWDTVDRIIAFVERERRRH